MPAKEAELSADSLACSTAKSVEWAVLLLGILAATHFVVDLFASTINPLWPLLERTFRLGEFGGTALFLCWSVSTSFSQLLFGALSDRFESRWFIWCGPGVALVCLSCIGVVTEGWGLFTLMLLAGFGVASFHPEAAAMAGSLLPHRRSQAMATFALCGYLGQSVGPIYSGILVEQRGLSGLWWGITWGLPLLALVAVGIRTLAPVPPVDTRSQSDAVAESFFIPPWRTCCLLLAIGALRIMPALGVPYTLAFLLDAEGLSGSAVGSVQSAFMAGIGLGAVGCAMFMRRHWERRVISWLPVCAAPVLLVIPGAVPSLMVWLVGLVGGLLGVTMPVYISYGQRMIPESPRVASAITMGVSWGIGAGVVAVSFAAFRRLDLVSGMFLFFACTCLASSFLCRWLPRVEGE